MAKAAYHAAPLSRLRSEGGWSRRKLTTGTDAEGGAEVDHGTANSERAEPRAERNASVARTNLGKGLEQRGVDQLRRFRYCADGTLPAPMIASEAMEMPLERHNSACMKSRQW